MLKEKKNWKKEKIWKRSSPWVFAVDQQHIRFIPGRKRDENICCVDCGVGVRLAGHWRTVGESHAVRDAQGGESGAHGDAHECVFFITVRHDRLTFIQWCCVVLGRKKNPKTKPKRLELMWKHVKEENSAQIYQGYPQQPLPDAGGHCRFSGDEMKTSRCLWPEMIID